MKRVPVVVLNMHYSGLGIARGLAPHGVPVFGLSAHREFPGSASRYCDFREAPDSLLDPGGLEEFLLEFGLRFDTRPILFPTRDHDIEFLLARRAQLERLFVIPMAPRDVIERAMNKDRCFEAARACGIALPRSYTVRSRAEVLQLRREMEMPVIVKPLYAKQWRKPGIWDAVGREKAVQIDDWHHLEAFYDRIEPLDPVMTIQEYVPGPESSLVIFGSYCRPSGELRAHFTARKLLQVPALRGTGVVVEGLPIEGIVEPSRRLLREIGFSGLSEIEYKVHEKTGTAYLIEINPRHWDQHFLGTACGVNLTLEWYRDLTEPERLVPSRAPEEAPRQSPTPVRWIADQEFALYAATALAEHGSEAARPRALLRGRKTFAVLDWRDPRPGLRQFHNISRVLGRAALARLRRFATPSGRKSGP
jgi:predicted ATP-grasp superfamily ATP-dependent carboligase